MFLTSASTTKLTVLLTVKFLCIKDKEALRAFFLENVKPNSMAFNSITDKINYLIENDYIESEFIGKYEPAFIEKLSAEIHAQKFRFQSFMAAYKFYQQYALKTNDGETYLESFEDRVLFNALYFADGDETWLVTLLTK